MSHNVPAAKVTLLMAKDVVPLVRRAAATCNDFNDLPNIPWYLRQQVRTIEGFLDKAETELIDLLSNRLDIDEALDYVEEVWPSD